MSNSKKIIYALILLFEIIVVSIICSNNEDKIMGKEKDFVQQSFSIAELSQKFGIVDEEVYYVDNNMADNWDENGEVFTYGPYASLYPGDYEVTLHYETDSDQNQIRIYSNENQKLSSSVPYSLPKNQKEYTFSVTIDKRTEDFEVQTVYFGEGYLKVESLDIVSAGVIRENNRYAALIKCVAWVFFFVLLDLAVLGLAGHRKHLLYLAVLLFLTLLISSPLYVPKLISGHDMVFHLGRIYGIRDGLLNGNFFVKLQSNWMQDYGYLVGVFYGDLFLYIPAVLNIMGLSMMTAYKVFLILITMGTAFITYFSIYDMYQNRKVSLLGSILYTTSIYRLLDLYLRHSVGESLALMFFPLIICGLNRIYRKENNRFGWLILSTGLFGLIHSHVLSCEMAGIFLLFFFLIYAKRTFRPAVLKQLALSFGVTILSSLGFLVPFLECYILGGLNVTNAARNDYLLSDRGMVITQLLELFVPAAGSNMDIQEGFIGEMPLTIGLALVCGIVLAVVTAFLIRKKDRMKTLTLFAGFGLLSIFMSTPYFPWDLIRKIPFLDNAVSSLQFPWRFLSLAAVFAAFCICESVMLLRQTEYKQYLYYISGGLILTAVFSSMYFIAGTNERDDYLEFTSSKELNLVNTGDEYLPLDTDVALLDGKYHIWGNLELANYAKSGTVVTADITAKEDAVLEVPLLYYKYYEAVLNGERLNVRSGNNGVVAVDIPAGTTGNLRIRYAMPIHWILSFAVSLITTVAVIIYLVSFRFKEYRMKYKEKAADSVAEEAKSENNS